MSEVKPQTQELAKALKKDMKVGDGGVITTEKDIFEKNLPEDLTMDTYNRVKDHEERFVASMTLATGELGEEALKKNKKLDGVTAEAKMGKYGDVSVGYLRSQKQTIRNPADPSQPPKEVTKYGVTSIRVRTTAQKNRGELKKVKSTISERAEKLFSK